MAKKFIALVVGHTEKARGAVSCMGVSEYDFNSRLAKDLSAYLDRDFATQVFFRDGLGIEKTYQELNKYQPDYVIELHFNSHHDHSIGGTETLVAIWNKRFGEYIQGLMCGALERGNLSRGVKVVSSGENGWPAVSALPDTLCCLIEPFFGSSGEDWRLFQRRRRAFIQALGEGLKFWDQGTMVPPLGIQRN